MTQHNAYDIMDIRVQWTLHTLWRCKWQHFSYQTERRCFHSKLTHNTNVENWKIQLRCHAYIIIKWMTENDEHVKLFLQYQYVLCYLAHKYLLWAVKLNDLSIKCHCPRIIITSENVAGLIDPVYRNVRLFQYRELRANGYDIASLVRQINYEYIKDVCLM